MFALRTARSLVIAVSLAAPSVVWAQTAEAPVVASTPTAFVQGEVDAIIAIVNRAAAEPAEREARIADLRTAVGQIIDFEVLASRTLGEAWEARTQPERDQFIGLLRTLVELSYSKRLGAEAVDPSSYTVAYTGERERAGRYTVEGTVTVRGEQHFVEVRLMPNPAGGYIVFDVITDDVSLEESYQESFSNIIREHGWAELIARMERRIADLEAR
jgi:ABC-type transporter MlaC component